MPCKTQVINDAQGQTSPQRISQRFVTLLKAIVRLLWLKFIRSLVRVSAMGACSPSSKTSCCFEKSLARCVPRLLSDLQITARVQITVTLLARYEEGDAFIHRIVTCDETWMHHYKPETKRASKEWRGMGEECPVKAKTRLSAGKAMATVFWHFKGVLLVVPVCMYTHTHIHTHKYVYTGCPRRNVPDFGRVFLMLKYTYITQNTYVQS